MEQVVVATGRKERHTLAVAQAAPDPRLPPPGSLRVGLPGVLLWS